MGDCVPRAISKALEIDWETAYDLVSDAARLMGDMPSADSVWGAVLRQHGFYRKAIPNTCARMVWAAIITEAVLMPAGAAETATAWGDIAAKGILWLNPA